ncbi:MULTISPECIES: helix-turn-helix domain-containing protein [Hyphomonadaceae]|jgi:hypothetical protein|nr:MULTISPECIES: helix-turn-helix domain-containing protein [Hyphomonadaceae]RAN36957.1 hypothetical protein HY11_11110 [Hyphomonas pacifica]
MKIVPAKTQRREFAATARLKIRDNFLQEPKIDRLQLGCCVMGDIMEHPKNPTVESPYLTAAEAAAYLRLEESTLNAMRWRKEGPNWRKHGGKVVYHRDALDRWSRMRDSDPAVRKASNGDMSGDDARS